MTRYSMVDIYWAEECVDDTPERAYLHELDFNSKAPLQFYLADETDKLVTELEKRIDELEKALIANDRHWLDVYKENIELKSKIRKLEGRQNEETQGSN